ncbi:hypothetical protein CcaCcLH18_09928 [Colletotrichum camelliae]|nr:hypothetical protein CcaCcLH18_09928 [Colletotrichum camelliae]
MQVAPDTLFPLINNFITTCPPRWGFRNCFSLPNRARALSDELPKDTNLLLILLPLRPSSVSRSNIAISNKPDADNKTNTSLGSPSALLSDLTRRRAKYPQDNSQHRRRPRPYGFLRKPTDFLERCASRAQIKPSAFECLWHPYPVSGSALLYNPGLDPRDPLAGCVIPCQLKSYVRGRHRIERTGQASLRRGATLANLTAPKTDCDTEHTPDEPKGAESKPFEGHENQPRSDRNRLVILPPSRRKSIFNSAATPTSTSRKRRAQDSEWDLIAGIADQAQFGEDPANRQSSLDPNKQGVGHSSTFSPWRVANRAQGATSHTAWLLDTMTSVRGAVTKVSNSIAGYGTLPIKTIDCSYWNLTRT